MIFNLQAILKLFKGLRKICIYSEFFSKKINKFENLSFYFFSLNCLIILLACPRPSVDQIHNTHLVGVPTKKLFLCCICHSKLDKLIKTVVCCFDSDICVYNFKLVLNIRKLISWEELDKSDVICACLDESFHFWISC